MALLQVIDFLRNQFQPVSRPVFGNRPAPAVVDQTPVGRDRNNPDLVVNGTGREFFVIDYLEVDIAQAEQKNSARMIRNAVSARVLNCRPSWAWSFSGRPVESL